MTVSRSSILGVLLLFVATAAAAGEPAFISSKNCRKCHLKEWKSWSETKMANAFELLRPGVNAEAKTAAGLDPAKDYTTDATCVRCHVTGHGQPGGFVSEAETPDLMGVGCEMCHGAGSEYTQDHLMSLKNKEYKRADVVAAGMVEKVGPEQCTSCHNSESPFFKDFDFETRKSEGTHEVFPLKYQH